MVRIGVLVAALLLALVVAPERTMAEHDSIPCHAGFSDPDGNGLGTTCDPHDYMVDGDGDGAKDSLEVYVGTNPNSYCSAPNDINANGTINTIDVGYFASRLGSRIWQESYDTRLDLNANEIINTVDVGTFTPVLNRDCDEPEWRNAALTALVTLRYGSWHLHQAPKFQSGQLHLYNGQDNAPDGYEGDAWFCELMTKAGAVWTDDSDIDGVSKFRARPPRTDCSYNGLPASSVNVVFKELGDTLSGLMVLYPEGPIETTQQCEDAFPCTTAWRGELRLDYGLLIQDPEPSDPCPAGCLPPEPSPGDYPDIERDGTISGLLMHELGHALGGCHPGPDASCLTLICDNWSILMQGIDCREQQGIQGPRKNDFLFNRLKY